MSAAVAVIDYGMGNRRSVEKALEHVGAKATVSADHDVLRAADALVLPGVGSFPAAMRNIDELGLREVIGERAAAGVPLLGICLGMQLLFESSEEHGGAEGLALLPGTVRNLRAGALKLPHIGWNLVELQRPSSITAGLGERAAFYHVHSLVAVPAEQGDVVGVAEYGERFATLVSRENVHGAQFHPEKSSRHGLELLANFAALARARAGAVAAA